MRYILITLITCILGVLSVYLYYENLHLKKSVYKINQENEKLNRSEKNLEKYEALKSKISSCSMNENSFVFERIDFVWADLDFNELYSRLNAIYRYDKVALITNFDVTDENEKGLFQKDKKFFKVKGFIISPCR